MTEHERRMAAHERRADELIHTVPKDVPSRRVRILRVIANVSIVVSFLSFGLGAVNGFLGHELATCTNRNLDLRNATQLRENQATRNAAQALNDWIAALDSAMGTKLGTREQSEAVALFKRQTSSLRAVVTSWNAALVNGQIYRAAHPLGHC